MWQPNKSTLLAVLVSVQAMILGAPLPWINEPGFATQGGVPQANVHRLIIQLKTIRHAMITWLKKIKRPEDNTTTPDAWQHIVEAYFKYNAKKVLDTVEEWSTENPHIKCYDKASVPPPGEWIGNLALPTPNKKSPTAENLALKLKELVLMENANALPSEDSLVASTKDSTEGKRKKSDDNAESEQDTKKGGSKRQKTETEENGKWIYTGSRKFKEVRAACHEFGIKADRTILESISKLEDHVNDNVNLNDDLALKYGRIENNSD